MTSPMFAGMHGHTSIAIPFPPSVNATTRAVNGRVLLSKEYRVWKSETALAIMVQRPKKHAGRVDILIELRNPDNRNRDCDNRIKPVLDALTASQIIVDDNNRYVREVRARWVDQGVPCRVTIVPVGEP